MPCRLVSPHLVHTTSVLCLVSSLDNPPSDFDLDLDLDLIVGGDMTNSRQPRLTRHPYSIIIDSSHPRQFQPTSQPYQGESGDEERQLGEPLAKLRVHGQDPREEPRRQGRQWVDAREDCRDADRVAVVVTIVVFGGVFPWT